MLTLARQSVGDQSHDQDEGLPGHLTCDEINLMSVLEILTYVVGVPFSTLLVHFQFLNMNLAMLQFTHSN